MLKPNTHVTYRGLVALTRHSFRTDICPSGVLVEVYRHGPLNHYIGFICSSQVKPLYPD